MANITKLKKGMKVLIKKNGLEKTRLTWGLTRSMKNMQGKTYKIHRVDMYDKCVVVKGCYFHPFDLRIHVPKREPLKGKFDPRELAL